jgi:hypothetical protein
MRRVVRDTVLVAVLGGVAALACIGGQWWLVGVFIACAYVLGRTIEARWWLELERERSRLALEHFTSWAEGVLASAPDEDELDDEQEEFRRTLQGKYHEAQRLLERMAR